MTTDLLAPVARRPVGPTSLVVAVVAVLTLMPLASGPKSPQAPCRIVSLELARTPVRASAIVGEWRNGDLLQSARRAVLWDFAFIPAYAVALALGALLVAGLVGAETRFVLAFLHIAAWLPFLAALLDVVENLAMLHMLRGATGSPWPEIAWACAVPKFLLVGLTLVALFAGVFAAVISRIGGAHAP